jgi:PAS domain S-box-containing protein
MTAEDLRSLELRLRAAVESSPSGLLMVDAEGRIVLVNREIERLFGYSREELLGRPVETLVPEQFRGLHPDYRAKFFNQPRTRAMGAGRDLFGRRKDGSQVPVEIGLTPIVTEEGLFVISSIVDISGRRRAEERFRAAVESSPNGMVMVDTRGRIVLVNREVERVFGYGRDELLGKSIDLLVPTRFHDRHPAFRAGFSANPQARAMGAGRELFGLRKDGSELPVEIGLNPIETEEGIFVLASILDISTRKQAEAERRLLESQLRQAQKMEAVGTLAGGIAHDFNNILAAVVGYAELVRDATPDRPDLADDLRDLLKAAERGRHLVERILRFSRRGEANRQRVDLGQVLKETTKLLRSTLPATIELRTRVAPDLPQTMADGGAMHQVVMNLATNAAHAMPRGGALEIGLEHLYVGDSLSRSRPDFREGPYLLLTVRDTGIGMDRETLGRALEPFFTTKPPGSGSGLGLTMVHGIVRDHAGVLDLESEPGKGTTVSCYLPAIAPQVDDEQALETRAPRGAGQRVLYLDDEQTLSELGKRRLQGIGYRVTAYTDPVAALEALRATPDLFDAVVTDYWMPRMTGLDFARQATEARPGLRILLLTGHMDDLPEDTIRQAGVNLVARKPVTLEELGQAMNAILTA